MPANKKHLSTPIQRFAKISAGLIGGYCVAMVAHLTIAIWIDKINTIITLTFSGFILWAVLFIIAFLSKNGWKVWAIYTLITVVFSGIIYLGKTEL